MPKLEPEHSWFGPALVEPRPSASDAQGDFQRLWFAFTNARWVLGLVLVALQTALYISGAAHNGALLAICAAHFAAALLAHFFLKPSPLGGMFTPAWVALIGVDIAVFSLLQWLHAGSFNYTPLFALPVLLASVLGSLSLAFGTAAGVTTLLFLGAGWTRWHDGGDNTAAFIQSGVSGVGYLVIAFLANQLASRLANVGQRARRSQMAATVQREVNELVIDAMPEGVMMVDQRGFVRAANPAAHALLGERHRLRTVGFDLKADPTWRPLLHLSQLSLGSGHNQEAEVSLYNDRGAPLKLLARTRLAAPQGIGEDSLCVLFLQDQRQAEAKIRTEKLASMGRMSTAVAHEIRNPLAAIAQANALLAEDLTAPHLLRLTHMVSQNTKRLEKIVDDILNVARVRTTHSTDIDTLHGLSELVHRVAAEWTAQHGQTGFMGYDIAPLVQSVRFDPEHLRQVLVNLLDNALRYCSRNVQAIQVAVHYSEAHAYVAVWSDSERMDQTVERHLFEPFFSSESRSSGLGLFVSRELCERHAATLTYQRNARVQGKQLKEGNEFLITLACVPSSSLQ